MVNPYEFLGVTPTSPMTEVRRAFFRLSLMCHPDKGGRTEDMRTLQSAYDWITHHIDTVKDHGTETYEEKEDAFKAFLESQQQEKILSWDEILKDNLGLNDTQFDAMYAENKCSDGDYTKQVVKHIFYSRLRCLMNQELPPADVATFSLQLLRSCIEETKTIEDRGWYHASIQGGYGSFLQAIPEDISAPIEPTKSFGRQEMILYEEPSAIIPDRPLGSHVLPVETLEDYSTESLCDYRIAHQDTNMPLEKIEESMRPMFDANINELYEQRMTEYEETAELTIGMRNISLEH